MDVRKDGKPPDPEPPAPRGIEARVDPPKNDEGAAAPAPPVSNGDLAFGIGGESQGDSLPPHPSPSGSLLSLSPLPVQGEEQGDERANNSALPGTKSRSDKAIESIASGVWDTEGARKLRDTLTRDWANDTADPGDPELAQWRFLALQPCPLRSDDNLRPPSQEEKLILEAYLAQRIELPHPPFFVNEILTSVQRTQLRQFHDDFLLYRLTAMVPPAVNISANVAHKTIMTQLFAANTRPGFGQDMFKKLMSDIERVTYDGSHLLTFVFASKSRAKPWVNTTLRFQRSILTLKDTLVLEHSKQTGEITMEQKELCYTVRVLADSEVSAVDLHLILSQLSQTKVVEVARPIKPANNLIHDNNYWNMTFYSTSCPQPLHGVTCVVVGTKALLLHHYQTFLRIPCFKCYSPKHSAPKCTASAEQCKNLRTRFTKHFRGKVDKTPMLSPTKVTKANYDEFEKLLAKAASEFATAVAHSLEAEAKMLDPANKPSTAGETTPMDTSCTTGALSSALPKKGQKTIQREEKIEMTAPSKPKKLSKKAKRQLRFDTFVNANRFSPLDDGTSVDEDEPTEHAAEGAPQTSSIPATCRAQDEDGDVNMTEAGTATPVKQQLRSIASDGLKSGSGSAAVAIFDMPASLNSSSSRTSSQLSHQSLELEVVKVKPGDQPRKLEFFLVPFHGKKQEVPADGNCMLYAYYATVTDCAATGFKRTPAVVHALNSLKRDLYTLMMSNLLGDIEIGLINPIEELARLFPERQQAVSQREATAQLFAHYKAERDVPANQRRPPQFWAGNNALRALAQLKREPIYVIDELNDSTAHVQRYSYRDFTLSDNEEHETGVHEVLSDAAAAHIFQEYLHCGVVPVVLVLDHAASHFWAVNHAGLLREWNGRPGSTMRERMNEAHKHLNDAELDWSPLKMDVCAVLAAQVERDLHADIDGGDLVTETSENMRKQSAAKGRAEPRPGERPSASVYTRILASASPEDLPRADREWYAQVVTANQAATDLWRRQSGLQLGIPQSLKLNDSKALENWLGEHPDACRSLFQVLPYPEVAAKQASADFLIRWGTMEDFAEQNAAISMLAQNTKVPEKARDHCHNWLQAMAIDSEIKTKIAGDGARWRRLCKMVANVADRSKPEELDKLAWHLLHLLPYTLFNWQGLIIGTRPRSLRAKWYAEHSAIRELCSAVVERNDWGAVTKIPEAPLGPKSTATGTNGITPETKRMHDDCNFQKLKKADLNSSKQNIRRQKYASAGDPLPRRRIAKVDAEYSLQWGFRPGSRNLTFWAASDGARGGVGILINPYSSISQVQPVHTPAWGPHFMAIQCQLDHMKFEVWNVYAPTNGVDRENLFSMLAELQSSENSVLIVGGDFNCTQWPMMDRSNQVTAARHVSKSLTQLLERRGLVDALIQDQDCWTQNETKEFRAQHHTYYYRQQDGTMESSRLDRWYLENTVYSWCREVQREILTGSTDHDGVRLHLQSMSDPRKMKRTSKLHPMPGYAAQQVNALSLKAIDEFAAALVTVSSTETSTERWDTFKRHLLRDGLRVKRQARRRITGTLRQKERRLKKRIGRLERHIHSISPTVESVTETLEELSLELDEDEQNIESLRSALRAIQERRQHFRTAKVYESHVQRSQKQSKHFFDRVSTKNTDNYMPLLKQSSSQRQRPPAAKAEIVADAWEPIMNGPLTDSQVGEDFLADIPHPSVVAGFFDELEAPITVAEVAAAINHLSDGKSPGPDRIPNGWYKLHRDRISPLLASLFTRWHRDCIFPSSFNEADIFCLKKNGDASDPMNYRPLALLNSDYKIYTRILATRLRKLLGVLVHPSQNGFVADRSIHDTIDMLLAAIKAAHQDPQLKRALAILMDFLKAYDTLDRGFLLKTLRHHRIPDQFVRVVEVLHAKTVVRFLANGERSRPVLVRCGIRQGCPLAPLLFILALDPLYRALERAVPQLGIRLRWKTQHVTQVASGFADDTTGYVPGPEALPLFLRITDDFGRASGLRLNREKTTILSLSGSITAQEVDAQGLSLLSLTETSRYLGIQIGSGGASEKSWELAEHQLRARLILAGDKTHTVDQRGVIASSIIIPKLLYIARHSWPSATIVRHFSRLIQTFVFHGTFTSSFPNRRVWLSMHHGAELREHGGLAFPDLRLELLALSAQVVDHWATTGDAVRQLVVDILVSTINQKQDRRLCVMYGTTSSQQLPIRIKKTLWSTGSSVLKIWAARPTPTEIVTHIVSVMNQLADLDTCHFQWSLNGVLFEATEALVITRPLQHSYKQLLGNFCSEWLLHVSWDELQWYSTAGPVNDIRAEFPSWIRASDPIGSTIRWEWEAPGRVRWWPKRNRRHMTRPVTAQFERLILLLVAHFPALLRRQYHHDFLRVETMPSPPPADFKLTIRSQTQPGVSDGVSIALTNVTAMSVNCQVQNALGRTYKVTRIHYHPRLHRAAVLWTKGNRFRPRRASLRSCIRNHSRQSTPSLPVRAAQGWARDNIEIGEAVSKVAWASIWKIDGASNADMLLFYRIKSRTLPLWVTSLNSQSCGAVSCINDSTTLSHVFIHCPKAQLLWTKVLQRWTRCGVNLGQNEHAKLLTLTLPPVSPTFWIQVDQEVKLQDDEGDQWLRNALHANWRLSILITLRVIWIWRNDRCHQSEQRSDRYYKAMLEKRLMQGAHFLERTAPIVAKYPEATKYFCYVRTALQTSTSNQNEPPCTESGVEYLAFFDGGSRGNPGAGEA